MDRRTIPPTSRSVDAPTQETVQGRSADAPAKGAVGAEAFDPPASDILRHAAEKFDELFGRFRGP
jgi:hypothetical protein